MPPARSGAGHERVSRETARAERPADPPGQPPRRLFHVKQATPHHRARWRLYGTVQGVGFRYFTRQHARRLGLYGCVRNRDDGCVEVEVDGARIRVDELLRVLHEGPPGARVERVEELPADGAPLPDPFAIVG